MLLQFALVLTFLLSGLCARDAFTQQADAQTQTSSALDQDRGAFYEFQEGDAPNVPGTNLRLHIERVQDQTSEGCLGGPVGCRDQARLKVTAGEDSKVITLLIAHTESQRKQQVNEETCFGYKFALESLKGKKVKLRIEAVSSTMKPKS